MCIFTIRYRANIITRAYIRLSALKIKGRLVTRGSYNCNID